MLKVAWTINLCHFNFDGYFALRGLLDALKYSAKGSITDFLSEYEL